MLPAAARVYCPGGTRALAQITEMFYELDADKGGTIDMEEACSFFKKQARLLTVWSMSLGILFKVTIY